MMNRDGRLRGLMMGLSEEEGVQVIRDAMGPGGIPPILDTHFNLRRWWRGWKGQVSEIVPRLHAYIENREAAGYAAEGFLQRFHTLPEVTSTLPYFSLTPFHEIKMDEERRSVVVVQRMEGMEYPALMGILTAGDFLHLMFAVCEFLLQLILQKEEETGAQWGITALIDFTASNFAEFCNPVSAVNKVGRLCTSLLQQWYCDILYKLVVFNPPSLIGMLWRVAKLVLNENTFNKLALASGEEELYQHFARENLPLAGEEEEDGALLALPPPRPLLTGVRDSVWTGLPLPPMRELSVKPRRSDGICLRVLAGQRVLWRFQADSDIAYTLTAGEEGRMLRPRFAVSTFCLPEEGSITAEKEEQLRLTFTNAGSVFFSANIRCALLALPLP